MMAKSDNIVFSANNTIVGDTSGSGNWAFGLSGITNTNTVGASLYWCCQREITVHSITNYNHYDDIVTAELPNTVCDACGTYVLMVAGHAQKYKHIDLRSFFHSLQLLGLIP